MPMAPRLRADSPAGNRLGRNDVANDIEAARRHRQIAPAQLVEKLDLLQRRNPQRAVEPEAVDRRTDLAIAVVERIEIFLHALGADAARDLLIDRHRRHRPWRCARCDHLFQASIDRTCPSQWMTSLSASATTPVSSAISACGTLKVEAGMKG